MNSSDVKHPDPAEIELPEIPVKTVPESEIDYRIGEIQKRLATLEIDALFIIQRVDLLYFSGTAQNAYLFIPVQGEPLLMVKKYYPRALRESPLKQIIEIQSVKEIPLLISDYYGKPPKRLGLEFDVITVKEYLFFQQLFSSSEFVDGSYAIHQVRAVKSGWELDQMKLTAELSYRTFNHMREILAPGYTEIEFTGMAETFARKIGHGARLRVRDNRTEVYPWHVLSGKNGGIVGMLDAPASGQGTSVAFPCGAGHKKLAPDEPIMIDFGFMFEGYHMDETRMFAINSIPMDARDACNASIEIFYEIFEHIKPGNSVSDLFDIAVKKAQSLGYSQQFLGPEGYKVTFIGHGIGMELVEYPIIAAGKQDLLLPGMTLAVEPKMVFENRFAAGIESVVEVTDNGCRMISQIPNDIFIVR